MIEAILQHVCRIPLPVRWLAHQPRLGHNRSQRQGTGMAFDQIREYQPGEAIRKINWAATARRGGATPMVNSYYEEKDITVMLLVDLSASMDFGSARLTKKTLAAEISASLVYSALVAHNRIGLLGFTSRVACYLPPRLSWTYQRAVPERILQCDTEKAPACFLTAAANLERWVKPPALVFLLSDFLTEDTRQLSQALARLRRQHDPIALIMTDPLEVALPAGNARVVTRDLETGKVLSYNFTRANQRRMATRRQAAQTRLRQMLHTLGVRHITVTPYSNYKDDLSQLFLACRGRASA